jgi:LysM repeat protein
LLQAGLSPEPNVEADEPAPTEKINIALVSESQEEIPAPHLQKLDDTMFVYASRSGDTLPALAVRFNVLPEQIQTSELLDPVGLIPAGTVLVIPKNLPA